MLLRAGGTTASMRDELATWYAKRREGKTPCLVQGFLGGRVKLHCRNYVKYYQLKKLGRVSASFSVSFPGLKRIETSCPCGKNSKHALQKQPQATTSREGQPTCVSTKRNRKKQRALSLQPVLSRRGPEETPHVQNREESTKAALFQRLQAGLIGSIPPYRNSP